MTQKVLFTGSRDATPEMLEAVSRYIKECIIGRDVLVIVGDADGIDERVIEECDNSETPIEVHGGYDTMRRKSFTGKNIPHDTDYLGRDRIMAEMLVNGDMCIAVWNGKTKRSGTVATARYAAKKCNHVYWLWRKYE